jgi:hypothetical protein
MRKDAEHDDSPTEGISLITRSRSGSVPIDLSTHLPLTVVIDQPATI